MPAVYDASRLGGFTLYIRLREWGKYFTGHNSNALTKVSSAYGPRHSSRSLLKFRQCCAACRKASKPGIRRLPFSRSLRAVQGTYWQLPDNRLSPSQSREPENCRNYRGILPYRAKQLFGGRQWIQRYGTSPRRHCENRKPIHWGALSLGRAIVRHWFRLQRTDHGSLSFKWIGTSAIVTAAMENRQTGQPGSIVKRRPGILCDLRPQEGFPRRHLYRE